MFTENYRYMQIDSYISKLIATFLNRFIDAQIDKNIHSYEDR